LQLDIDLAACGESRGRHSADWPSSGPAALNRHPPAPTHL